MQDIKSVMFISLAKNTQMLCFLGLSSTDSLSRMLGINGVQKTMQFSWHLWAPISSQLRPFQIVTLSFYVYAAQTNKNFFFLVINYIAFIKELISFSVAVNKYHKKVIKLFRKNSKRWVKGKRK